MLQTNCNAMQCNGICFTDAGTATATDMLDKKCDSFTLLICNKAQHSTAQHSTAQYNTK